MNIVDIVAQRSGKEKKALAFQNACTLPRVKFGSTLDCLDKHATKVTLYHDFS